MSDLQSELTEARRKSHATDLRSRTGEAMQACQIKELKVQGVVNIWVLQCPSANIHLSLPSLFSSVPPGVCREGEGAAGRQTGCHRLTTRPA